MKALFFLGNWLLIISNILLVFVYYQAYHHFSRSQRQRRTIIGITAFMLVTMIFIVINIVGYLFSASLQYVSLCIFLVTSGTWFTSSLWRGNIDAQIRRQFFILAMIPFFAGLIVVVVLLFYTILSQPPL
jgi:hypothetical protein